MRGKFLKNEQGFTLVELMIVVAIIGILAAIAIPNYQTYQAKARQSEAKVALSGIYTALQSFAAEQSSFTACLSGAGYALSGSGKRYYVIGLSMDAADGAMCGPDNNRPCIQAGWVPDGAGNFNPIACAGMSAAVTFAGMDTDHSYAANATVANGTMVADANLAGLGMASIATAPTVTAVDNVSFVAAAAGAVSTAGANAVDEWTIDQNKMLINGQVGL